MIKYSRTKSIVLPSGYFKTVWDVIMMPVKKLKRIACSIHVFIPPDALPEMFPSHHSAHPIEAFGGVGATAGQPDFRFYDIFKNINCVAIVSENGIGAIRDKTFAVGAG